MLKKWSAPYEMTPGFKPFTRESDFGSSFRASETGDSFFTFQSVGGPFCVFFQSIETVDNGTYLEGPPENAKVSWFLRRGSRYGAQGVKIFDGWSSHRT